MKKMWKFAKKINKKTGIKATSIFLFLNVIACTVIAFFVSAVVDASNIITSLNSFDIYFIIIGYAAVIGGFFGGSLFIMQNE